MGAYRSKKRNKFVALRMMVLHRTDKAYLLLFQDKQVWVPKQWVVLKEARDDDTYRVELPVWLWLKSFVNTTSKSMRVSPDILVNSSSLDPAAS